MHYLDKEAGVFLQEAGEVDLEDSGVHALRGLQGATQLLGQLTGNASVAVSTVVILVPAFLCRFTPFTRCLQVRLP